MTKDRLPFTASEDITVYKVLINRFYCNRLKPKRTLALRFPVPDDGIMRAAEVNKPRYLRKEKLYAVTAGMIHAFNDFTVARHNIINHASWIDTAIYLAVIPKWTHYYKGMDGDICSEVLHIDLSHYIDKRSSDEEVNQFASGIETDVLTTKQIEQLRYHMYPDI